MNSYFHYTNLALRYPEGNDEHLIEFLTDFIGVSEKFLPVYLKTRRMIVNTTPGRQLTSPHEILIIPFCVSDKFIEVFYDISNKILTTNIIVDGKTEYLHRNVEMEFIDVIREVGD